MRTGEPQLRLEELRVDATRFASGACMTGSRNPCELDILPAEGERPMFLAELDAPQRRAFCGLAQYLILSDKVVDLREEQALVAARREMGLRELVPVPDGEAEFLALTSAFNTPESQRIALLEATFVAMSDRDMDERERSLLVQLSERLGLGGEELEHAESWATTRLELRDRGRAFVAGA